MLEKNVDMLLISEMKLDDSVVMVQFKIDFTTLYRYGRNNKGCDPVFYIREEISSHLLQCKQWCNVETFLSWDWLQKNKLAVKLLVQSLWKISLESFWMLKLRHFEHSKTYENFIVVGDFNVGSAEISMKHFCDINSIKHLIKAPTWFRNTGEPKCIDLMLTLGKFIP